MLTELGASIDALIWCIVELNLGIAGGCVTAMRPFAQKYFPQLLGLSSNCISGNDHPLPSDQNLHPLCSVPRTGKARLSFNYQYSPTWRPRGDNLSQEHILPKAAGWDNIKCTMEIDPKDSEP